MEELKLILEIGQNASAAAIGVAFAWAVAQMLVPGIVCFCIYKVVEVFASAVAMTTDNGKIHMALLNLGKKLEVVSPYSHHLHESELARTLAQLEVAVENMMEGDEDDTTK